MAVEIVLVTDDTEWQTSFSRAIKEYPDLHEKSIYSSYDNVDIKEISHIHCAVVDIDLAASCKQSYEAIRSFVFSYNPKRPVIIAIGTQDQRYINEDSDRYGIDFYSKKYPVEESVKMALETIEVFKTIIIGK